MFRIAAVLACVAAFLGATALPAQAATKYTSCASMHKDYKYGIAKSKKAQKRAVREGMYKPPVRSKVYKNSYKTLDRDKDGVMCEVPR